MPKVHPRAIFIGPENIGNALADLRKEWEFLPSSPDITTFWEGLVDGTIDNNIHAILVLDQFFDPTGDDSSFEKLVATMSPHCLFLIINYTENISKQVRDKVDHQSYATGDFDAVMYYFINPRSPNKDIDSAIQLFASDSQAEEAVAVLTGRNISDGEVEQYEHAGPVVSPLEDQESSSKYFGQIVAVTSSKGGSGKSTISTTLATYMAHASEASAIKGIEERPLKILILDLDVRDGQLGFLTGESKPTVIHLRLNGISEETIAKTIIHKSSLKVDLLLAPKRPRNSDDTPPDFYIELLNELKKQYDYIFLDTSVNYLDPLLEKVAYPVAHQIVFITEIVINSVFSMTRWIQEVTRPKEQGGMGIESRKIGIVVNKALANVSMTSDVIKKSALGLPIIAVVPSNPKIVAHSANMVSMELLLQHPEIRASIRRVANSIIGDRYQLSDDF